MGQTSNYYIYLMRSGPYYKIGVSKDPRRRLRELRVGNVHLRLLGISRPMSMREAYRQEKAWFRRFVSKHVAGEWYELNERDVARVLRRPPDDADDFEDHPVRDWLIIFAIPVITVILLVMMLHATI